MSEAPTRRSLKFPVIVVRAAAVAAAALSIGSCAMQAGATLSPALTPGSAGTIELTETPFYPDSAHQAGPAALATMLAASGATATPAELASLVYLASQRKTLQAELRELPPRYERLSYEIAPELAAILVEIDAHHPVLVLQNSGTSLLSKWHFAVLIGYDAQTDTVVLRSGTTRREVIPARSFMLEWSNAERWGMLILRPGELPALVSRERYLAAAMEFERTARPENSVLAFNAALKRWPDEPSVWIGRAAAQLQAGDLAAAARDYSTGLRIDGSNAEARNSLALTLLDLGCIHKAQTQIDLIRESALPEALRTKIEGSRDRIADRAQNLMLREPPACAEFAY